MSEETNSGRQAVWSIADQQSEPDLELKDVQRLIDSAEPDQHPDGYFLEDETNLQREIGAATQALDWASLGSPTVKPIKLPLNNIHQREETTAGTSSRDNRGDEELASVAYNPRTVRRDQSRMQKRAIESWIPHPASHGQPALFESPIASLHSRSGSISSATEISRRRINPKVLKTRRDIPLLPEPRSNLLSDFRKVASIDGMSLYRLCDMVPYLLAPKPVIVAQLKLLDMPLHPSALKDQHGNDVLDQDLLSDRDTMLINLLCLLQTPEAERHPLAKLVLKDVQTQEDRLMLYMNVDVRTPEFSSINVSDFIRMAYRWMQFPNPALIAREGLDCATPWATIVGMLRERRIDIGYVDKPLYFDLIRTRQGEDLDAKLAKLQHAVQTGDLATTQRRLRNSLAAAGLEANHFVYTKPKSNNPNELYAKRFSHQYPLGRIVDPAEEQLDSFFDRRAQNKYQRPTIKEVGQTLKEKKKAWMNTAFGKAVKGTIMILVVTSILAGILIVCYFKLGQKKKGYTD